MHALIGLGNPDAKYAKNRHNVGFMFLDWLLDDLSTRYSLPAICFAYDKYTRSELTKTQLLTNNFKLSTLLVKPQTYMNKSGESVQNITTRYSLPAIRCFIVHDDLDLRLGNFKVQMGVGPKKHNGLSSIEHHLKTHEFWRVRIGVDNRIQGTGMKGEAYVLSNFTQEELGKITSLFPQILKRLKMVLE